MSETLNANFEDLSPTARRVFRDLKNEMEKRAQAEEQDPEEPLQHENHSFAAPKKERMQCKLSRFSKKSPDLSQDKDYSIKSFLDFHDHDFIVNAYQGILGRSPDSDGYHSYLNRLRQGNLTKIEILGRLRFSSEGRSKGVKVKGLLRPFAFQSSYRIPVLGHFIALTGHVLRLPIIIRNFIRFEAYVNSELRSLRTGLDANMEQIEDHFQSLSSCKADLSTVEALSESKAGREELQQGLDELSRAKADLSTVASLTESKADREELQQGLDQLSRDKADLSTVEALSESKADREELKEGLDQLSQDKADSSQVSEIVRQVSEQKRYILDQQRRLALLLEEARKRMPEALNQEQLETMVREEDHLLDAMYVSFEDQFRGTREDIKNRVSVYVPVITEAGAGTDEFPVLDIGCGRGEWLELLKEKGLTGRGFDLNRVMVQQCQELGLQVQEQEAVAGLRELPPNSLGAITGMHIIEHLPFKQMIALFDEALRVIKSGGVIIFETPNPENILVGAHTFYSDPSHKNPLPPQMIQYLVEARGFVRPQIMRLHPNEVLAETLSNVPEISPYFSGPQDYSVIAYKAE
jgi:O-antigen chain-terminating methyltransferase